MHCWWECKLVQPLWRTVWRFLKKLKIELPCDPAIPLMGIYSDKTIIQKDTCTPIVMEALFTLAKTWNQPKCPLIDEWIKKMWYIYTVKYYSAIKEWNNAICSNMYGPNESNAILYHLDVESKIQQMNISMKQTHRHWGQICGCQRWGGWRREGLRMQI